METDLQEAQHGLQTANETKVEAILEGTHRHQSASGETLPVGFDAILLFDLSGDGYRDVDWMFDVLLRHGG